jgi:hypothetical protein
MAMTLAPMAQPRAALTQIMDGFLAALADRDPRRIPLADTVRYTENGQLLAIGDGAWGTVTALGGYRHDLIDSVTETIATFATIVEGHTHSILVARIAVIDGQAAEIEVMIARPDLMTRDGLMSQGPAKLNESAQPDAHWFAPIPDAERMSREELRRVANLYFVGLEKNDGKGDYPFSDDCLRIENGARTTAVRDAANGNEPPEPAPPIDGEARADRSPYTPNFMAMSARQQFETGYFAFVDRIRHRRFPIIDPERGLVFTFAFFDHSGTVRDYPLANGRIVTSSVDRPFTWEIGEAFKIEKGLITRIEAVMTPCPYGMPPNWPMLPGDIL